MKRATEALVHEAQTRSRDAQGKVGGDDVDTGAGATVSVTVSGSRMVSDMKLVSEPAQLSSAHSSESVYEREEMRQLSACWAVFPLNLTQPAAPFDFLSPVVATVPIAPEICQGQPPTMYSECFRFQPDRFTFG